MDKIRLNSSICSIMAGLPILDRLLDYGAGRWFYVTPDEELYFGVCPECGDAEWLNYKSSHWIYCPEHKTRWCIGANLFSSWKWENQEIWDANKEILEQCQEAKAAHWYSQIKQLEDIPF